MEALLPSEVARLVYGYLLEAEKCSEAASLFLQTSPNLKECYQFHSQNGRFSTRVMGLTLLQCLDHLCSVYRIVQSNISSFENDTLEKLSLPEQLNFLLESKHFKAGSTDRCARTVNQIERKTPEKEKNSASPKKKSSRKCSPFKSPGANTIFTPFPLSMDDDLDSVLPPLETTSLDSLPGNTRRRARKSPLIVKNEDFWNDDGSINQSAVDVALFQKPFLDKPELCSKISKNINKALNLPDKPRAKNKDKSKDKGRSAGEQLDTVIKSVVNQLLDEDPLFDDVLAEIIDQLPTPAPPPTPAQDTSKVQEIPKCRTLPVIDLAHGDGLPTADFEGNVLPPNDSQPELQAAIIDNACPSNASSPQNSAVDSNLARTCNVIETRESPQPSETHVQQSDMISSQSANTIPPEIPTCHLPGQLSVVPSHCPEQPTESSTTQLLQLSSMNREEVSSTEPSLVSPMQPVAITGSNAQPLALSNVETVQISGIQPGDIGNPQRMESNIIVLAEAANLVESQQLVMQTSDGLQHQYYTILPRCAYPPPSLVPISPPSLVPISAPSGIQSCSFTQVPLVTQEGAALSSNIALDQHQRKQLSLGDISKPREFVNIAPKSESTNSTDFLTRKKTILPHPALPVQLKRSKRLQSGRQRKMTKKEEVTSKPQEPLIVEVRILDSAKDSHSETSPLHNDPGTAAESYRQLVEAMSFASESPNKASADSREISLSDTAVNTALPEKSVVPMEIDKAKGPVLDASGSEASLTKTAKDTTTSESVSTCESLALENKTEEETSLKSTETVSTAAGDKESETIVAKPEIGKLETKQEAMTDKTVTDSSNLASLVKEMEVPSSESSEIGTTNKKPKKLKVKTNSPETPDLRTKVKATVTKPASKISAKKEETARKVKRSKKPKEEESLLSESTLEVGQSNTEGETETPESPGSPHIPKSDTVRAIDEATELSNAVKSIIEQISSNIPLTPVKGCTQDTKEIVTPPRNKSITSPLSCIKEKSPLDPMESISGESPKQSQLAVVKSPLQNSMEIPSNTPETPEEGCTQDAKDMKTPRDDKSNMSTPNYIKEKSPLECNESISDSSLQRPQLTIATRSPQPKLSGGWDKINGMGLIVRSPKSSPPKSCDEDSNSLSSLKSPVRIKSPLKESWDAKLRAMLQGDSEEPRPPKKQTESKSSPKKFNPKTITTPIAELSPKKCSRKKNTPNSPVKKPPAAFSPAKMPNASQTLGLRMPELSPSKPISAKENKKEVRLMKVENVRIAPSVLPDEHETITDCPIPKKRGRLAKASSKTLNIRSKELIKEQDQSEMSVPKKRKTSKSSEPTRISKRIQINKSKQALKSNSSPKKCTKKDKQPKISPKKRRQAQSVKSESPSSPDIVDKAFIKTEVETSPNLSSPERVKRPRKAKPKKILTLPESTDDEIDGVLFDKSKFIHEAKSTPAQSPYSTAKELSQRLSSHTNQSLEIRKTEDSIKYTPKQSLQNIFFTSIDQDSPPMKGRNDYEADEEFLKSYSFSVEYELDTGITTVSTNAISEEFILLKIPSERDGVPIDEDTDSNDVRIIEEIVPELKHNEISVHSLQADTSVLDSSLFDEAILPNRQASPEKAVSTPLQRTNIVKTQNAIDGISGVSLTSTQEKLILMSEKGTKLKRKREYRSPPPEIRSPGQTDHLSPSPEFENNVQRIETHHKGKKNHLDRSPSPRAQQLRTRDQHPSPDRRHCSSKSSSPKIESKSPKRDRHHHHRRERNYFDKSRSPKSKHGCDKHRLHNHRREKIPLRKSPSPKQQPGERIEQLGGSPSPEAWRRKSRREESRERFPLRKSPFPKRQPDERIEQFARSPSPEARRSRSKSKYLSRIKDLSEDESGEWSPLPQRSWEGLRNYSRRRSPSPKTPHFNEQHHQDRNPSSRFQLSGRKHLPNKVQAHNLHREKVSLSSTASGGLDSWEGNRRQDHHRSPKKRYSDRDRHLNYPQKRDQEKLCKKSFTQDLKPKKGENGRHSPEKHDHRSARVSQRQNLDDGSRKAKKELPQKLEETNLCPDAGLSQEVIMDLKERGLYEDYIKYWNFKESQNLCKGEGTSHEYETLDASEIEDDRDDDAHSVQDTEREEGEILSDNLSSNIGAEASSRSTTDEPDVEIKEICIKRRKIEDSSDENTSTSDKPTKYKEMVAGINIAEFLRKIHPSEKE